MSTNTRHNGITPESLGLTPEQARLLGRPSGNIYWVRLAVLRAMQRHQADGTLPTSGRFIFYELAQDPTVPEVQKGTEAQWKSPRKPDRDVVYALRDLRNLGFVDWADVKDETREMTWWRTAPSIAEYVAREVDYAALSPWRITGKPAPLIICESRSLAGVLRDVCADYCVPLASTNGQCKGFTVTEIAPSVDDDSHILYLGDYDNGGRQIEANTRRIVEEHSGCIPTWERLLLTREQVFDTANDQANPLPWIRKRDKRYEEGEDIGDEGSGGWFTTCECEALGQRRIIDILRGRLDELLAPTTLAQVREREDEQRREIRRRLRELTDDE